MRFKVPASYADRLRLVRCLPPTDPDIQEHCVLDFPHMPSLIADVRAGSSGISRRVTSFYVGTIILPREDYQIATTETYPLPLVTHVFDPDQVFPPQCDADRLQLRSTMCGIVLRSVAMQNVFY